MSSDWSLPSLLESLHQSVEDELTKARKTLAHPTEKGDASESVWIDVLNNHLPRRYSACKAHVVDCNGKFSEQIDIVIHDRQYSPLVFKFKESLVIPSESVYAVFEAKQDMTADHINYAQKKIASVRRLHRTSVAVPTVNGLQPPKQLGHILGGLLTLSCAWAPPFAETMHSHLIKELGEGLLDLGCVANTGMFSFEHVGQNYTLAATSRPATRFIFELIARLQEMATVPMLDIRAYAAHIP